MRLLDDFNELSPPCKGGGRGGGQGTQQRHDRGLPRSVRRGSPDPAGMLNRRSPAYPVDRGLNAGLPRRARSGGRRPIGPGTRAGSGDPRPTKTGAFDVDRAPGCAAVADCRVPVAASGTSKPPEVPQEPLDKGHGVPRFLGVNGMTSEVGVFSFPKKSWFIGEKTSSSTHRVVHDLP